MRQNSFLKLTCLALFYLLISPVWSVSADDFAKLRKDSARISTMTADFVQKKSMKILSKPLISNGKFYYAAPDSIRWEYSKPLKSVVLSGKGQTKRYIPSGGKMVEDKTGGAKAMQIVLGDVAGWMNGKYDTNPAFTATIREGNDTMITMTPTGKNMAGMIEKIEIAISQKNASVKSVRIVESATSETQIDFQNVVVNKSIDPSVFQVVQ
ncbi:MAG: lipoprotein chaperone [Deltaproteobacteria bacterium ADurb.Bin151]|jgi:outer membrane lipoprotein-sorting protein|nr:outer membrane lipoprotein carrier protein LolA [Smithella sp.]OQB56985.1 MAG: lipoprotein chaperone [Deltaproteobacteria bacterium ADurb.Bin151]HNZ10380.1 outer membrane lipoprotein carrier protein LolA [Smithellaceae bacterium]HOG81224.1 outer membrane lipoprotein carrier protein LolA [Smithellaceae bacterium]HOQ41175.1 outer membrane lipoprotein carrier protein LolA [Smithellaceae bacterium]